jgi:hypothetical protein
MEISLPTQFEIRKIEIDKLDVLGLFTTINLYENIYSPTITGNIIMMDSDYANFIEKHQIEGNESIEFEFANALGEVLSFSGFLNGMRDRTIKKPQISYSFDFHSKAIRKNETQFVTQRFVNETPQDIVGKMIDKLGGTIDNMVGNGLNMNFIGSRKRPTEIIKYVLTHGVSPSSKVQESSNNQEANVSGITGFLAWETLGGYRFASIEDIKAGKGGKNPPWEFQLQVANRNTPVNVAMWNIISYNFERIGDFQTKLRAGAFKNTSIIFDIDKGIYKEYVYDDTANMTKKQKEAVQGSTRYLYRVFSNERLENKCDAAADGVWDQSKQFLSQNIVGQNTFDDELGSFTLPPRFQIRAGDTINIKIPKIATLDAGGYDKKHSGRYVIRQVGHHLFADGRAYTKISTTRSTIQQDDASSTKVSN